MNNLSVLYVEDDDMVRANFEQILQRYFKTVYVAKDGEEALAQYNQFKPKVAILDISIPIMNGLDVAQRLRDDNDCIEIIMLTAYSDHEKLLKAVNLQLFAYLLKPVKKEELNTVLNKLIEKLDNNQRIKLGHSYNWDKQKRELFDDGMQIKLTKNEKLLVDLLVRHQDRYYKPCEISYQILDETDDDDMTCNNIVQLISRFKKRMIAQNKDNHFFIQNTYGSGYKLML